MTYYDEVIRPAMHADRQWQNLTKQLAEAEAKLAKLRVERINYEGAFIAKIVNGPHDRFSNER